MCNLKNRKGEIFQTEVLQVSAQVAIQVVQLGIVTVTKKDFFDKF